MAFDVSWFAVHSFGLDKAPILLSSLDRKGVVTTGQRDWKSTVSLERVSVLEFLLQVHGSEDQDFGNYYCSVTPWVRSPTGSWQREAEIHSRPIFITVKMDGELPLWVSRVSSLVLQHIESRLLELGPAWFFSRV